MLKSLSKSKPVVILLSALAGLLLAVGFFLNSSHGVKLDDPDALLVEAVDKTLQDDGSWAFQASVTEGAHPWGIDSVINAGQTGGDTYCELYGKGIRLVTQGTDSYLLFDKKIFEGFDGVLKLSNENLSYALKAKEVLDNSGLLFDPTTINTYKVTNTLAKTSLSGRLQHHYEIERNINSNNISSVGRLLNDSGYEISTTHKNDGEIASISGDAWIDNDSGKLTKLLYQVTLDDTSYTVEVVPIVAIDFSEVNDELATAQDSTVFSDLTFKDSIKILNNLKLSHLASEIKELILWSDLQTINTVVEDYARDNYFYPTLKQLKQELSNRLKSAADAEATNYQTLIDLLGTSIDYKPLKEGCLNEEEQYCSSYKLWIDGVLDGVGDADSDGNLIDYFLPD